jgi:hypothetical protein
VLRRYRSDPFCRMTSARGVLPVSYGFIERVVFDGDQQLYEIRAPGMEGQESMFESDHPDQYANTVLFASRRTGRVLNTHGLGIDRAVSVTRLGHIEGAAVNRTVYLHANWRGQYTSATDDNGWVCMGQREPQLGRCLLVLNLQGAEVISFLRTQFLPARGRAQAPLGGEPPRVEGGQERAAVHAEPLLRSGDGPIHPGGSDWAGGGGINLNRPGIAGGSQT